MRLRVALIDLVWTQGCGMRNPRKVLANRLKQGRREWLAVLILAGSPVLAQQPATSGLGVLPPLPLETPAFVLANPYCEAEATQPQPTVQLTNGRNQPSRTVRLSPIGAAIALNSIDDDQRLVNPRPAGLIPVMTIEPTHRSAVQSNPLIQSAHHDNAPLVDTAAAPAKPVTQAAIPSRTGLSAGYDVKASGNSIVLVNPAPKQLLIIKPNSAQQHPAVSPVQPAGKPQQSLIPQVSAQTVPADSNHPAVPTQPTAIPRDKPVASAAASIPANPTTPAVVPTSKTTVPAQSLVKASKAEQGSSQNTVQPKKPTKPVQVGSIAAMLAQHPDEPSKASTEKTSTPIFFSLSDNLEVAPTSESQVEGKLASKTGPTQVAAEVKQPPLPAPVTLLADGSIVTAPAPKPKDSSTRKSAIPTSILADQSQLGKAIGLPTPRSSPKPVSQPVLMPRVPATAKPLSPQPKSILASKEPAFPAAEEQQLLVAPLKGFRPRSNPKSTKSVTAAKPFTVPEETAKSKTTVESSTVSSVLAKSPPLSKSETKTKGNSKSDLLTLPQPVNIPDKVADAPATQKSGKSIIEVKRPSPKGLAKNNPHLETPKPIANKELKNPFEKRSGLAASQPPAAVESGTNQTVTVDKYKINKENRKPIGTADSTQRDGASPIAKGVVKPMSLGKPNDVAKQNPALDGENPQVNRSVVRKPASTSQTPASTDQASTEPASTEPASTEPASTDQASTDQASTDQASTDQASTDQASTDQASTEPASIVRTTPTANEGDITAEHTILKKRSRPPVTVQTLPTATERQPAASSVNTTKVQPVPDMVLDRTKVNHPSVDLHQAMSLDTASELKDRGLILGPHVKLTPLHMNQAQVRSLTLGGSVRGVRVGDKGICQAFASGPNQLKLIGTGIGITRLVVWAQKNDKTDEVLMRAFEIHVDEVVPSEGNSIENTTELLNQSIRNVFPNCQATVKLVGGKLCVAGQCDNQESAEKIIRMVRKSCLIPVRDQLVVK